mgnify:CR=1 FL=1
MNASHLVIPSTRPVIHHRNPHSPQLMGQRSPACLGLYQYHVGSVLIVLILRNHLQFREIPSAFLRIQQDNRVTLPLTRGKYAPCGDRAVIRSLFLAVCRVIALDNVVTGGWIVIIPDIPPVALDNRTLFRRGTQATILRRYPQIWQVIR